MTAHFKFGLLTIGLLLSASCSVQRVDESMARVDKDAAQAAELTAIARNQPQTPPRDTVVFSDKPWVSTQPVVAKRGLPTAMDCGLVYRPTISVNISDIAQFISRECGVTVLVSPDAVGQGAYAGGALPGTTATGATPNPDSLAGLMPAGIISGAPPAGANPARGYDYSGSGYSGQISGIKYEGPASGLLDLATSRLGLSWKFSDSERAIRVNYFETKVFDVYAFGDKLTIENTVRSGMNTSSGVGSGSGGGSSGGSSGGSGSGSGISGDSGSNQSTKSSLESSIMTDIEKSVRAMLSSSPPGKMFLSPSTGTITVTDRPEVIARVESYLNTTNHSITQQVLFNVKVVEVTLTDKDQLALNMAAVYSSLSNKWGLSLSNTVTGISSNAISGSIGILDTANSAFAGSNVIIKALAEQGRVSDIRSPSVTTLNLQPAPIQIGHVTGYIPSTQVVSTAQVGSTSGLTPGTITSGFNMTLMPRIMDQNEMLVMITINMNSKPTFTTFTSNGSSAQVPDYDAKSLSPKVKLRSGQTLILSGFDEATENADKQGAGSPGFFGLGGGRTRSPERSFLVVLITPILLGQATNDAFFDSVAEASQISNRWAA